MNTENAPTNVACLTPPGIGAIASIVLHGARAWEIVRALFQTLSPRALPAEPQSGHLWLGRIGGAVSDQVVVTTTQRDHRAGPWVEVHCHGGGEVVRLLLEEFTARGARACSWQALEHAAAADPLQALAAAALAEARTPRTAAILLDQYHGALRQALDAILAARGRGEKEEADRLQMELDRWAQLGRRLTNPWRVTIAGAPNAGKSSLLNALAGYQRSIVAATPGTTRDVVTLAIALDGWPVELADTAGQRADAGVLEEKGIYEARRAMSAADLCLWVVDASAPPVWPENADERLRLVVNKIDLAPAWDLDQAVGAVRISAHTGAGMNELCQALSRWLVPEPPPPGAAVPFTA